MNQVLPVPTHDASKFSWEGSHGVTEASNFPGLVDSRVWTDAVDVGFKLRSDRTGKVVLFIKDNVDRSSEGDILCTTYVSYPARDLSVMVFND